LRSRNSRGSGFGSFQFVIWNVFEAEEEFAGGEGQGGGDFSVKGVEGIRGYNPGDSAGVK
jgi:hypothetical protein